GRVANEAINWSMNRSRRRLSEAMEMAFSKRPVTKVSNPHGRISAACAIAISPKRKQLSLYFRLLPDNTNFTGHSIASFLKYVHEQLRSPLTMIWDSIPIHSAEPVRSYLRSQREVVLERVLALAVRARTRPPQIGFEITAEDLVFLAHRLVVQEVADHIEDRAIQDDEAGFQPLVSDGLHQVAFADAGRPE